ncbi:MAG TPA: DUF5808 domain-containing protein [Candidatus Dormibacteraeota bacterium]|nr:DUF5808 domain-containing protein [Candidatus Dormibacteraeota bacterium]
MRPGRLLRAAILFLTLAAVAQELNKPESERRWHGRVAGVPYDFRFPTVKRFREAYWNPDDPRIFTDKVVGLGWAINFARLIPRLQESYQRLSERT